MILRKFMKHLTEQNWFAVGLDVLVVITGIFLGMQVTELNDARKERSLERNYIERLYEDFTQNVEGAENLREMHERYHDRLDAAVVYLLGGKLDPAQSAELVKERLGVTVLPSSRYQMVTYYEMVSGGNLHLLQDTKLRHALQSFAATKEWVDGQLSYFRQNAIIDDPVLDASWEYYLTQEGEYKRRRVLDTFVSDKKFINSLANQTRTHNVFAYYRRGELEAAQKVFALLVCNLDLPECEKKDSKP